MNWTPKPEYLLRPRQLSRRFMPIPVGPIRATLPWGLCLDVEPREVVGNAIWRLGVHDLLVCEALARLAKPGDLAIDAGANIGQMTSLLASRVGPNGRVVAFEAHPAIAAKLSRSATEWQSATGTPIEVHASALSVAPGFVNLETPPEFSENRGVARVGPNGTRVPATTLDDAVGDRHLALLKLDVEGHEAAVLDGASRLFADGRIDHVVFEDHHPENSPVVDRLRGWGAVLYGLDVRWSRPVLTTPSRAGAHRPWQASALLATFRDENARREFSSRGWRSLQI